MSEMVAAGGVLANRLTATKRIIGRCKSNEWRKGLRGSDINWDIGLSPLPQRDSELSAVFPA
jgi:hypothetical protein